MNIKTSESSIVGIEGASVAAANRAQRQDVRKKVAIAREILADNTVPTAVVEKDNQKFGREAHFVTTIFSILVAAMLVTWYVWDDNYLQNEDDLIYNLGLVGGIMMLLQFIYAARKRSATMRRWGLLKKWFNIHIFIGLTAPVIIIIHSRFELLSINGTVAFISMLVVVFSGIVGRYLYSQVNFDLTSGRRELKILHNHIQEKILAPYAPHLGDMESQLKAYMINAFAVPGNIFSAAVRVASVGIKAKILYLRFLQIKAPQPVGSSGSASISMSANVLGEQEKLLLRSYLDLLARMARYTAYKKLFSLWRIGHVPVIYLLLVTGLAHVLAVHMY